MTTPTHTMSANGKPSIAERLQDGVLVCIVLIVGLMAGAASFNHVHDWTIANSPTGTADWFGWANAVISELIPTASLIEIGRRRRNGNKSIGYPMVLLVGAVGVSLTAQLAVAQPTVFGWIVSALPALAFFALSKLVFTATKARPTDVPAPEQAASPAPSPDIAPAKPRPAIRTQAASNPAHEDHNNGTTGEEAPPAPATPEPVHAEPVPAAAPVTAARTENQFPERLLTNARTIADAHRDQHGEPITAGKLAVRLKVPTLIASDILTRLNTNPTTAANTTPHNGSTVGAPA